MANKQPMTIGPYTLIDFPKFGVKDVPAKVDTGADSSSIWASQIKEVKGKLSFVLFDINSPFYSGEKITTSDFSVRLIKNSFGHKEFRYTAKLPVSIEGRDIKVRFSLANRSGNTYPVLIGRRTLQKRFLVDVSKDSLMRKFNILALSSEGVYPDETKRFFKGVESQNSKIHIASASYSDLIFIFNGQKTQIKLLSAEKDLADFDMVYMKSIRSNSNVAAAVAAYLHSRHIPYMDKAAINYYQTLNKLYQYTVLSGGKVNIPKSIYIPGQKAASYYDVVSDSLGTPFLLKDIRGKHGKHIYLITDKKQYDSVYKKALRAGRELIAQEFIPHDEHYRVLILGKRIEMVIKRVHKLSAARLKEVTFRSQPVLVKETTLSGSARRMAITAAELLMVDIAGVDMLQDKDSGAWYCLEVNDGPQLVTGAFVEEKEKAFSEFLSKQLQSRL